MKKIALVGILSIIISFAYSQALTIEDYERAVSFARANYYNKTAFNLYTDVEWMEDNEYALFSTYDPRGRTYKKVSLSDYEVSELFDHDRVRKLLKLDEEDEFSLSDLNLSGNALEFAYEGSEYLLDLRTYRLDKSEVGEDGTGSSMESESPDGKWVAFVKEYNLYLKEVATGEVFQLSENGSENYEYGTYYGWFDKMEGENGKRPERFWVNWCPDSKYLSTNLIDLRNASKMYMLDYSKDDSFRPTLHSYYRGSPGDTNMVKTTLKVFDVNEQSEITFDLEPRTHINGMSLRWWKDREAAILMDTKRGFQQKDIYLLDLKQGSKSLLFQEVSETNIDDFTLDLIPKQNKLLFLSQRSGWRQMYSYDLKDKKVKALTEGEFVINDIESIDEDNGVIYFMASGTEEEMNPYHQRLYKVNLDGEMTLLTPETMHHQIDISSDHQFFVDNFSTVQQPTKTVLRSLENGEILASLSEVDASSLVKKGWNPPMVFSLNGKDEKTKIYGALWRPTNFDPTKKYPIIDHSYTGPHTQVFPKSYDQAFSNQALAELGFLVVMIDGLGTAGRSKAFANHSYKNMGNNLEDHVLAIKSLAERNDWIDIDRVGIFGHSAGGYDAGHAVLAFPDFYKVAVASSADHDFRMEKAWWPEMYMGWPVDSTYHEVSNITMASNLKGKLLLVHGNMDDNVNVSATYKLAEALIKADKEFDLLIMPSQRHGYTGNFRKYFIKKRWNYFIEHLAEKEPIWSFKWDEN